MGKVVMAKKAAILTILFLLGPAAFGAKSARKSLLRDGLVLMGVEGKLTAPDSNNASARKSTGRWFFELASDISDGENLVRMGTKLELLPSATLERMIADARNRPEPAYKLKAKVTKYRGDNYVFPISFLPLAGTQKTKPDRDKPVEPAPTEDGKPQAPVGDPNDVVTLPKEMIEKLDNTKISRRPPETGPGTKGLQSKRDSILVNRIGLLQDAGRWAPCVKRGFGFDAFGRNIRKTSLGLLPCEALERAERRQSAEVDRLRFKVTGIGTGYEGRRYLLLHKATRVYSHGNFPG
jgi:hypothetical protein